MAKKIKVFIDVFYYQATLSGIRTYINELVLGAKNSKNKNIEYLFSHDINRWDRCNPNTRRCRYGQALGGGIDSGFYPTVRL